MMWKASNVVSNIETTMPATTKGSSVTEGAGNVVLDNHVYQRSQHRTIITLIHSKTLSLAKTVQKYSRRHRDLLGVLDDAVEALHEFKDVEWPPQKAEMEQVLSLPSWMADEEETDDDIIEREDRAMSELARRIELGIHIDDSILSESAPESEHCREMNAHGNRAMEVDATLEKELQEIDVLYGGTAEPLHNDPCESGEKDNNYTMISSSVSSNDEEGSKECVPIREDQVKSCPNSNIQLIDKICEENHEETTEEAVVKSKKKEEEVITPNNITNDLHAQKVAATAKFESIIHKNKSKEPVQLELTASKLNVNNFATVDAAASEPMHPAVITTLHCLCMVISSESKTIKMIEIALECITLLTNGRYVCGIAGGRMKLEQQRKISELSQGEKTLASIPTNKTNGASGHDGRDGGLTFLGYVVESITQASDSPSEVVQGGMAKALLAIMTCPKCGVHEAAMLQAVRSTFHVYLVSKTASGKELARRTLVDMLKCVFNRMEAYDIMNKDNDNSNKTFDGNERAYPAVSPLEIVEDDSTVGTTNTVITHDSNASTVRVRSPSSTSSTGVNEDSSTTIGHFASQYHTDSYLLFRALCKLSSKTLPGDENVGMTNSGGLGNGSGLGANLFSNSAAIDPLALNSKILSLELIFSVFNHCGDAFRNGEKFIYAVQSYLCMSLLKNCMSNQTAVAHLSLKIFLLLVKKFKTHLKAEIEVFVANIFLRVLESPNSPFEQKVLVLEALRALCADSQMLTQLFLNYDCDFDAVNLYKDIVYHVTKISARACAPSSVTGTKRDIDQESDLSRTGLEVLVVILRSFLKALDLPGGDDTFDENDGSSSLSKLRQNLKLDIGTSDSDISDRGAGNKTITESAEQSTDTDNTVENQFVRSSSDFAEKIVDAFDKKRTAEQNFEIGMVKFTLSLKAGVLYFIENGFVQLDAQDMARFLHENKERLDKTQTGELLGKEADASFVKDGSIDPEKGGKGFYLRVLYHYVDLMNFGGLPFDDAMRLFLSGFRLPGEAQKIDRIMEKFAERFTRQNPDVFPSADTAFILAFSVIMLNTDLHNPSIKPEKRMTLESFIRNNKGISAGGGDLPEAFLSGIFNRIKEHPFSLKEDDEARQKFGKENATFDSLFVFDGPFGSSFEERKREKYRKEREEMMAASERLFKKRPGRNTTKRQFQDNPIDSVSPGDVVKPMFDVTWGPLIGTLSQVLESSTNDTFIALCLSGFVYSIRISSHSGMSLARNTFVNSLAKFTTLGSVKEMKSKNIECIRTLLSIAIIDGEYLGESWSPILQCISQLGRLHLFASGHNSDDRFLQSGSLQVAKISDAAREMEENNGKAVLAAVNEILIDKVFSSTVTLSARGIVSFINQLIAVSDAEILGDTKKGISGVSSAAALSKVSPVKVSNSGHGVEGPRIFSLQRLVEVADCNMDIRPRVTWSQIWENMGRHFAKVGCNENAIVSMFAIDALRQLSFKFLEKPELTDFNFQRLFLKPFLLIMENTSSRDDVRELVLRCIDNIIRSMAHNLRSGWKIFFSILMCSSRDPSAKINTLGLAILQRLLDEHLNDLFRHSDRAEYASKDEMEELSSLERLQRNANADDFVGLCRASLSFVHMEENQNPLPIGLSMRALCHAACYSDLIADKSVLPPDSGFQCTDRLSMGFTYKGLSEKESLEMAIWRPLLDGLASGLCSSVSSISGGVGCLVQRGSLMTLRAILLRHGKVFSVSQWSAILNFVVLPAIQIGAENEISPVLHISSESPSVSSLDFLGEPLPLPPPCNDEGLQRFASMAQSDESSPSRPLGIAELLVEASFADLRHGGDGDLSKAYNLKKNDVEKRIAHLQPFPDSWIATTAPIALGMMSDLLGEHFLHFETAGREILWPLVMRQLLRWTISVQEEEDAEVEKTFDVNSIEAFDIEEWQPCEALVRIGCKEWARSLQCIINAITILSENEVQAWLKMLCMNLSETIAAIVNLEKKSLDTIVITKLELQGNSNKVKNFCDSKVDLDVKSYLEKLLNLKTKCIASHCLQQYLSAFSSHLIMFTGTNEVSCLLDALNKSIVISRKAQKNQDLAHAFQEACFDQWGDSLEEVDEALKCSRSGTGHRGSSPMFFLTQEASATKAEILLLSSMYHKTSGTYHQNWDMESFSEPLLFKRVVEVLTMFLHSEEKDGSTIDPNVWRSANESGCQVAYFCTSFASVVICILETILILEVQKFERHKMELFPILCSLIHSQSGEIRHLVSNVLRKQVGTLINVLDCE